jgi:hypothetical protein
MLLVQLFLLTKMRVNKRRRDFREKLRLFFTKTLIERLTANAKKLGRCSLVTASTPQCSSDQALIYLL